MRQENERLATKNDSTFVRCEGMFAQLEILLARTNEHSIRLERDEASLKEKSARLEGAEADCYKEKAKRTALAQRYFEPFERWFVVSSVVRGQLGDRVHLLDGGEKVRLEVSGVN